MADPLAPITRSTETVLRDRFGRIILSIKAEEWTVVRADGSIEHRKLNQSITLEDGSSWNPGLAYAQNPVHVGCCETCRDPPFRFGRRERPSHGLVRLARAKTCVCGSMTCPRHRQRCADGKYRCPRCARRWAFREFFLGVFFTRG